MNKLRKSNKGFTLIELLIVLFIISIVAAVVGGNIVSCTQ